jgi:large subunit ribosomal protein L10
MTKAEKTALIEEMKEIFASSNVFYITDCSTMTVAQVNKLRANCFEKGVTLKVVKNTIIRKALEQVSETQYTEIFEALHGPTAVMFAEGAKTPAQLIKEFRGDKDKPYLKAAYIDSSVFLGDDQLETLLKLKSKEELVGEIIGMLQSPMQSVLGALQSGGNTIAGLVKTLEERSN